MGKVGGRERLAGLVGGAGILEADIKGLYERRGAILAAKSSP